MLLEAVGWWTQADPAATPPQRPSGSQQSPHLRRCAYLEHGLSQGGPGRRAFVQQPLRAAASFKEGLDANSENLGGSLVRSRPHPVPRCNERAVPNVSVELGRGCKCWLWRWPVKDAVHPVSR